MDNIVKVDLCFRIITYFLKCFFLNFKLIYFKVFLIDFNAVY